MIGLRDLIYNVISGVQNLQLAHKFFSASFIVNERDYMKKVTHEVNEIKQLFDVYGLTLM